MPTDPLWLEHTEKAAWDTVQALRDQVQEAQARSERLLRLEPSLPRIAELVEEARAELGSRQTSTVGVLEELLKRLRSLAEERERLTRELTEARAGEGTASDPATGGLAPKKASRSSASRPSVRWLLRQLERRRRELAEEGEAPPVSRNLAEAATLAEERLRAAVPLPYAPESLLTVALDLGLTAVDLARAARRALRG